LLLAAIVTFVTASCQQRSDLQFELTDRLRCGTSRCGIIVVRLRNCRVRSGRLRCGTGHQPVRTGQAQHCDQDDGMDQRGTHVQTLELSSAGRR
ncbi:MAG: hypothetical protein ACK559_00600, partial [bacterium]